MALRPSPVGSSPYALGRGQNEDYTFDLNPQTVKRDPRFLKDIRDYFSHRGDDVSGASDDELVEKFYTDRTWRNNNTVSMARDVYEANTADAPQAQRLGRLQKVFDALPERGFFEALPDYAGALLLDPVNLVGGAGAARAGVKAAQAAKTGWRAAARVAAGGAAAEAAVNAPISGVQSALMQQRNVEVGNQEEVNLTEIAKDTGFGAAIGGAMGLGIGAGSVAAGRVARNMGIEETITPLARGRDLVAKAAELGLPAEDIRTMSPRALEAFVRAGQPVTPDLPPVAEEAAVEPTVPKTEAEQFAADFDRELVNKNLADAEAELDSVSNDPTVSEHVKIAAVLNAVTARELQTLDNIIKTMEEKVIPDLASPDNGVVAAARKMQGRIEILRSRFRALRNNPSPEKLAQYGEEIRLIQEEQAEQAQQAALPGQAAITGEEKPALTTQKRLPAPPAEGEGAAPETPSNPGDQPSVIDDLPPEGPGLTPDGAVTPDVATTETPAAPPAKTGKKGGKGKKGAAQPAVEQPAAAPVAEDPAQTALIDEVFGDTMDVFAFAKDDPNFLAVFRGFVEAQHPEIAPQLLARLQSSYPQVFNTVDEMRVGKNDSIAKQLEPIQRRSVYDEAIARGATPERAEVIAQKAIERATRAENERAVNATKTPEEIIEDRNAKSSGTGNAVRTLAEGPVTAGRSSTGRIQGVLRPGRRADVAEEGPISTTKPAPEIEFQRKTAAEIEQDVEDHRLAQLQEYRKQYDFETAKSLALRDANKLRDKLQGIENRVGSIKSAPAENLPANPRAARDTSVYRLDGESEANRTITEGDVPTKSTLSREEVEILAQRPPEPGLTFEKALEKGIIPPERYDQYVAEQAAAGETASPSDWYLEPAEYGGVVAWKANTETKNVIGAKAFPRVNKKTGREYVVENTAKRGDTIYYNSQTRRWYANEATAYRASGLKPGSAPKADDPRAPAKVAPEPTRKALREEENRARAEAARTARAAEAPTTPEQMVAENTPAQMMADMAKRIASGDTPTPEEYAKFAADLKAAKAAATETPTSPTATATGIPHVAAPEGRLLAIRNKTNGNVRVLTPKQQADGAGPNILLGQGNPADWEVGSVPEGVRTLTQVARESFTTASPEAVAATVKTDPSLPKGLRWEDLGNKAEDLNDANSVLTANLSAEEMAVLTDTAKAVGVNLDSGFIIGDRLSFQGLYNLRNRLDTFVWVRKQSDVQRTIKNLSGLNALFARLMPDGIILPVAGRAEATAQIESVFRKYSPAQAKAARDFLARIAGDARPIYRGGMTGSGYTSFSPTTADMNVVSLAANPQSVPLLGHLYHETAHWAYRNILTPEDRVAFWRAMEKYYPSGTADLEAIKARSPDTAYINNATLSPQEFFANQFVASVMRKEGPLWQDTTFWDKIAGYVKAVIDRFFGKDFIDPDLEPLFAKIIPDDAELSRRSGPTVSPKTDPSTYNSDQSQFAVLSHAEMDDAYGRLREGVASDDPSGTIQAARDLATLLAKLTKEQGAFGAIRGYEKTMKDLGVRIWGAIYARAPEASNFSEIFDPDLVGGYSVELDSELAFEKLANLIFDGGRAGDGRDPKGAIGSLVPQFLHKIERSILDNEGALTIERRSYEWSKKFKQELSDYDEDSAALLAKLRADHAAKRVADEKKRVAENKAAVAEAVKPLKVREDPKPDVKAAPPLPSTVSAPMGKSAEQVLAAFKKAKTKEERTLFGLELMRKSKAMIAPYTDDEILNMRVAREVIDGNSNDLQTMLDKALAAGDTLRVNEVMFEAWRRQTNKRFKSEGKPVIKPPRVRNSLLGSAISQEKLDNVGAFEGLGIPPSASPSVKAILNQIVSRTPEQTVTARTLTYRALAMMGRTMQKSFGDINVMTIEDVYRLAGEEGAEDASGVFMDFRHPAFKALRGDLRKIAIGLTEGKSDPFDVMHEVFHLAVRTNLFTGDDALTITRSFREAVAGGDRVARKVMGKYGGTDAIEDLTPSKVKLIAEEWFAESGALHAMGKVAKGDMFQLRESGGELRAKSRLMMFLERLIDGAAYLVNGITGRNEIKQMFRRVYHYGDMFADRPNLTATPRRSGYVTPEYAPAYFDDVLKAMPPHQKDAVKRYTNGSISQDENGNIVLLYHGTPNADLLEDPQAVMRPGTGTWGEGIYLSPIFEPSFKTYANNPTSAAQTARVEMLFSAGKLTDEQRWLVENNLEMLNGIRDQIARLRRRGGDELDSLLEAEARFVEALKKQGYEPEPEVFAFVSRASKPFDASVASEYNLAESAEFIGELENAILDRLIAEGLVDEADLVQRRDMSLLEAISYTLDMDVDASRTVRGHDIYEAASIFVEDLAFPEGTTPEGFNSATLVNKALGDFGHDSIIASHFNQGMSYDAYVLIDHYDADLDRDVSASELLKSIDSADFDAEDPRLFYSRLGAANNINGDMVTAMMDATDALDTGPSPAFASRLSPDAPRSLNSLLGSMLSRKTPGPTEQKNLVSTMTGLFGAQSSRLEAAGLKWLANFHRQHYVDQHVAVAERILPIKAALDALPDATKGFKRWLQNSNPVKRPAQPASHERIVRALRFGMDTPYGARLSAAERAAALSIRDRLEAELQTLKKSGVIMGEIKNYFPQVWNIEAISRDPDKFTTGIANYFMAEAKRDGRAADPADARARAEKVMARLTTEEVFYVPPPLGASREATSDAVDFQRLIRLDDPDFRSNLDELNSFLESDLETLLVKYFDGTTRRSLQSAKFGTLNHGYYDYLRVAEEGRRGIAYLLSHNRVARKDIRSVSPDGYSTVIEWRDETTMPFLDNGAGATEAADKVIDIWEKKGDAAAKAYLMSLDVSSPPVGRTAPTTSVYEHRVDAIIAAIRDFKGEERQIHGSEIRFAQDALRLATKKPVDTGPLSGNTMRKTSQAIRAFNSVSLLAFTVLASIPDLVMPTIRSGSFKTHMKALKEFSGDAEYREAIRASGVAIESILHQRMTGLFGADSTGRLGRATTAFFNATMLTPWTDMNREISAAVGYEMFKADIKKASNLQVGDGSDMAAQKPEYRKLMRRLSHYGLADYARRGQNIDDLTDLEQPDVRKALLRFANETIFAPSPDDMPLWTNTPVGAIVWQLKAFPLMMTRLAGDMVDDVKRGEYKRPAYFLSLGPAAGAAALAIRDIAQQRGEDEEATLRHRNWYLAMGYDEKLHGSEDDFLGWYMESMLTMGGLGLVADLLHTTATSADNGAYGTQRILSALFGPTVGTISSAVNVIGGAEDGLLGMTPDSNAKERTAVRELVRRVPVVGGMGAVREGVVDAAFEDTSNAPAPAGDDAGGFGSDMGAEPQDDFSGEGFNG
jgi:hypothetical protein